jgi:hypothetical protein
MIIGLGADPFGVELKESVKEHLGAGNTSGRIAVSPRGSVERSSHRRSSAGFIMITNGRHRRPENQEGGRMDDKSSQNGSHARLPRSTAGFDCPGLESSCRRRGTASGAPTGRALIPDATERKEQWATTTIAP